MRGVLGWIAGLTLFAVVIAANRADLPMTLRTLGQTPTAIAVSILVHVPQLLLTALAWRSLLPGADRPSVAAMARLRWIRESLTALLPAGGIIGQTVAARRLARAGVAADLAGATAVVDMTVEAATQAAVTLAGLVLLIAGPGGGRADWLAFVGVLLAALAVSVMVVMQRRLPVRLARAVAGRLTAVQAAPAVAWLADLQAGILRLHADRATLARAALCHCAAWSLGAVEVAGVLRLLGHPVSLGRGFIVEALVQALRSAAFMVPGAVGIQEGAVIAACALVGVPPPLALVLALVRRARELLLGVPGLIVARASRGPSPGGRHGLEQRLASGD